MNTITHILMALAVKKYYNKNNEFKIPNSFVYGSFAPDILLYVIVLLTYLYYQIFTSMAASSIFSKMFDYLYFNDPLWIFSYNILHSPLVIIVALCFIYATMKNNVGLYKGMGIIKKNEKQDLFLIQKHFPGVIIVLFFFLGCLFHVTFDIPLHNDDGPLLMYPINDELRYNSPISYWDPDHFGREFAIFELAFMLFLIGYLTKDWFSRKLNKMTNS